MPYQPTIHILLATYNGAKYLQAQLDSISRQTYCQWTLTVSDDGSTDETVNIVKVFAQNNPQPVTILQGPCMTSSTRNFCHLIQHAPIENGQDLYAFCDQDDVWHYNKLDRAVQWHAQRLQQPVRLYCGRTQFVNEQLKPIGLSPGIRRPPSFGNALVQNIASGNTMVFSHAVLMAQKKIQPAYSVWHDWTTYIVTTALGGLVWFDDEPCLFYRQHAGNVIGSNNGTIAAIMQTPALLAGRYRHRAEINNNALKDLIKEMPAKSAKTFEQFQKLLRAPSNISSFLTFFHSPLRRQKISANLMLGLALLLGFF